MASFSLRDIRVSWATLLRSFLFPLQLILLLPLTASTAFSTSLPPRSGGGPTPQLPLDILATLTPILSPSSQVLLPSDPSFSLYTSRARGLEGAPTFLAVVLPATESDVSAAVRYANDRDLPFLAISGQHGSWTHLGRFRGIAISLQNLKSNQVRLEPDGRHAVLGGGTSIHDAVRYLWSRNRQTTMGMCECVGAVAVGLGGGHGFLQGRYGLVADQWVSARVVLGSGEFVTVSEEENDDLWWGLRGAGHNFGIVTEVRVRVYEPERGREKWAWEMFTFKGEQLEDVYAYASELLGWQQKELSHWTIWWWDQAVDKEKPVITFLFFHNGSPEELENLGKGIRELGPAAYRAGVVEYPDISAVFGITLLDPACQQGNPTNGMLRAADVEQYEVPALRKTYDLFSSRLSGDSRFAYSMVMLEGYSVQAVQAVPAESTAFGLRSQRVLQASDLTWARGNTTFDKEAQLFGQELWRALSGTAQKRSYPNYAFGDEGPEALYGYEPWRLQKLRSLKKKYDPEGRFGYFASFSESE